MIPLTILSEFECIKSHVGHDVACVIYGGNNVSVECLTCNEVLYSVDKDCDIPEEN